MKKAALILGILIFLDFTYFSYVNASQTLIVNYKPLIGDFSINSGLAYMLLSLYGALGGALLSYYKIAGLKEQFKKQSRKSEKASIETEESTDRMKALEAKIATLETALKEALKKKE